MTLGWRGRGCCAVASCKEKIPAAVQARVVTMEPLKVIPLVLDVIVVANEQGRADMSMILQALKHAWEKGGLGLLPITSTSPAVVYS